MADAKYSHDPACQALGITLDEVGAGRARARMTVAGHMANGHGIAHGGYIFLLADSAFAYACNGYGPVAVAQSAQVTFVRAARINDVLTATAVERTRYGRHGVYDVTVTRDGGEVVAEFRGHSVVLTGKPDAWVAGL